MQFYPAILSELNLHVHSFCCDTSIAFFLRLETAHHHPHCSPTFRSLPCWVPVVIAMCYQEWQMIIWLRSHIYKSSSTTYTEHHNNHMITSSHIQIRTGAWSRFGSTHARVAAPPHNIVRRAVIVPADKCGSNLHSGRLLWSLVHVAVLLRFYDCSENAAA